MTDYPYKDGPVTVIGPECFASEDESVISWKGENYVPQSPPQARAEECPGCGKGKQPKRGWHQFCSNPFHDDEGECPICGGESQPAERDDALAKLARVREWAESGHPTTGKQGIGRHALDELLSILSHPEAEDTPEQGETK